MELRNRFVIFMGLAGIMGTWIGLWAIPLAGLLAFLWSPAVIGQGLHDE